MQSGIIDSSCLSNDTHSHLTRYDFLMATLHSMIGLFVYHLFLICFIFFFFVHFCSLVCSLDSIRFQIKWLRLNEQKSGKKMTKFFFHLLTLNCYSMWNIVSYFGCRSIAEMHVTLVRVSHRERACLQTVNIFQSNFNRIS